MQERGEREREREAENSSRERMREEWERETPPAQGSETVKQKTELRDF